MQFLVHTADIELLNYWMTRRFSGETTYYLVASEGLLPTFTEEISTIGDYQVTNFQAMDRYLSNEKKRVEASLKELRDYQSTEEDLQIYY